MRSDQFFRAAESLPLVGLEALIPSGGALVLAPHPDDESLGCGGLLALLHAAGRPASVLVMSDGAGSHPRSHSHPAPVLRALRRAETLAAAAELGLDAGSVGFLDWPDGAVPSDGPGLQAAVASVLRAAEGLDTLLATVALDPHCDHEATWAVARAAAARGGKRLLGYPVWGWRHLYPAMGPIAPRPLGAAPAGWRLDVSAVLARKRRAVLAHRSQTTRLIGDDPDGFVLPAPVLEVLLRSFELFLEDPPT